MFASLHTSTLTLDRVTRRAKRGISGILFTMLAVRAQRRALAAMDDSRLADLGLSRADAMAEAARPIWDVPARWTR